MPHQFGLVPQMSHQRSTFRRDHKHKTTLDAGWLVPIYVDEVLPGDTMSVNGNIVARLSTPIAPIMDDIFIDTHFFYVPNRLVWDNWERFCGAQDNPGDSTDFLVPRITCPVGGWPLDSLPAYFGVRPLTDNLDTSALFTRAYNLCYNEMYRDQNLQDSIPVDKDDGPDDPTDYVLRRRCKRPDYFTTCLPYVQKGDDVLLPLGDTAPVVGIGKKNQTYVFGVGTNVYETGASAPTTYASLSDTWNVDTFVVRQDPTNLGYPGIYADLSAASAATVNALRFAFAMQRKRERDARSGTRYVEHLAAHWGVTSPDYRLQRPEYLGGGSQRIDMQTVPQTAQFGGGSLGTTGAFGISVVSDGRHGFFKSFVEHGVIIGLVNVRAELSYQQGVHRMFTREKFDDFYLPVFQGIGEQAVLNKEIYAQGTAADEDVFGYQEYGAEYKYGISKVTGLFNSEAPTSLDFWHLGQDFASLPPLNGEYIQDNPPIDRVVRVNTEPHVIMDSYFSIRHTRAMPVYNVPGMIDHF